MGVSAQQKQQLLDRAQQLQARGMAAVAQAPAPLRRALGSTNLKFRAENGPVSAVAGLKNTGGSVLAGVEPGSPDTINVIDQKSFEKYAPQTVAHEMVHNWANNLPPELQKQIPDDDPNDPYNFGGVDGLNQLRAKGGTILSLPREKAAAMVQYYSSQGGQNAPKNVRDAVEPYLDDMNKIPLSQIQPTGPEDTAINTTPRAPLPPGTDVPGAVQPAKEVYAKGDPAPGEKKKPIDLSAGMVKKADGYRGKGKVVAFDEATHLPVVRHPGTTVAVTAIEPKGAVRNPEAVRKSETEMKSASMSADSKSSKQVAKPEVTKDTKPERATKYEFGSTQANISADSDAHKAITEAQKRIPEEHLAGKGLDVDKPHVTVRYGIQGDDTAGIKKYLGTQKPFEAKLGKTKVFPPSKNSDGAAVVHAEVHSPDLHRMNSEIAKHGKFKESDFPDYKPHVTLAYVKPEVADKYKGMADAEGKSFKVTHVAVSDKDGNHEEVPLGGKQDATAEKPKKPSSFGSMLAKGQMVHLNNGISGTVQHVSSSMKIARIKTREGKNMTVRHGQISAIEDAKNDRNRSAESTATA